jgi:hypothetical protein
MLAQTTARDIHMCLASTRPAAARGAKCQRSWAWRPVRSTPVGSGGEKVMVQLLLLVLLIAVTPIMAASCTTGGGRRWSVML